MRVIHDGGNRRRIHGDASDSTSAELSFGMATLGWGILIGALPLREVVRSWTMLDSWERSS